MEWLRITLWAILFASIPAFHLQMPSRPSVSRLVGSWTVAMTLWSAVNTAAWFLEPDFAGTSLASVMSGLVLLGPALAVVGFAKLNADEAGWSRGVGLSVALPSAYLTMALSLWPAVIVFVELGGDTL